MKALTQMSGERLAALLFAFCVCVGLICVTVVAVTETSTKVDTKVYMDCMKNVPSYDYRLNSDTTTEVMDKCIEVATIAQ